MPISGGAKTTLKKKPCPNPKVLPTTDLSTWLHDDQSDSSPAQDPLGKFFVPLRHSSYPSPSKIICKFGAFFFFCKAANASDSEMHGI